MTILHSYLNWLTGLASAKATKVTWLRSSVAVHTYVVDVPCRLSDCNAYDCVIISLTWASSRRCCTKFTQRNTRQSMWLQANLFSRLNTWTWISQCGSVAHITDQEETVRVGTVWWQSMSDLSRWCKISRLLERYSDCNTATFLFRWQSREGWNIFIEWLTELI